jgi:hypothetical protein
MRRGGAEAWCCFFPERKKREVKAVDLFFFLFCFFRQPPPHFCLSLFSPSLCPFFSNSENEVAIYANQLEIKQSTKEERESRE